MTTTATTATLAAALREIRSLQAFAMTDERGMRGDNGAELESIIATALAAYEAERLKDAEARFEQALSDLRELGCEPAMVGQSALAFRLYHALHGVREAAGYNDSESPNYTETSGGSVEWGPGYFAGWMAGTHDLLEEFKGTLADPDGL